MDKIKKIFSPGHKTDDDTLYGSGDQTTSNTTGTTGTTGTSGTTGTTGTTGEQGYSVKSDPLYANSAADNESGLKRQILNPGNDKYDEHRFNNTTGETGSRPAVTGTSGLSNTTNLADRTATGTNDSHLGRDTAIAGGVGAAGHRAEQSRLNDTTGNNDLSQSSTGRSFPLGGNSTTSNTGVGNTTGTHDSHLGRDAAVAGGVGTAGYEAEKHHHGHHGQTGTGLGSNSNTTGTSSNLTGGNTGLGSGSNTTGTHNSHLGRDAAVAGGVGTAGYEAEKHHHGHHHHGQTGTDSNLTGSNTGLGSGSNTTGTHNSHLGRDAAVAGGVGAAGYEAEKHHHRHDNTGDVLSGHNHKGHGHEFGGDPCPPGDEPQVTGYPHHFAGPHATDTANRLDPHVAGEPIEGTGHHLGRDAAVAGGVGAAGYEAEKHHHGHHHGQTGTGSNLSGSNSGLGSGSNTTGLGSGNTTGTHGSSHLGRDAAVAGGVGTAGYEAEKHHHHHGQTATGSNLTGSNSTGLGSGSNTGLGSSNTTGTHDSHHLGRDAAVAGGVGAAGYEAEKHHHHHHGQTGTGNNLTGSNTGLGSGSNSTGLGSGSNTGLGSNNTTGTHGSHHLGRDAAVAGGVGAAGYEAEKHHHQHGQTGAGGFDDQRYNPSATSGTSHGLRSGEQGSSIGYPSSTSNTSGTTSGVDPRINPQAADSQKSHHYGRDAALVGGAGAVGTGAYEAEKHHHSGATGATGQNTTGYGSSNQPISSQVNNHGASSGIAGVDQSRDHHYGRDAAVAGGAGAAGLGAYELGKDHDSSRLGAQSTQQPLSTPTGAPRDARVFDQTQQVPQSNQAAAGWATDSKEQEKLAKQHDKELRKEEKHHDKALQKEEKREEKAEKKEIKREEKEEKKEEKHEKKGGLLGFLHKDKTNDENVKTGQDYREADQANHLSHQQQLERDAAAGTAGVAGAKFEPSVHDQQQDSRISTDGTGHNRLHKDPPAKVQNELDQRAREQGTGSSSIPQSAIGSGEDRFVTDPHTGLEMNVGKYGSGAGGVDGSSNIPGYHTH